VNISFHSAHTDHARGGALYFYSTISGLLSSLQSPLMRPRPHDFFQLISDPEIERLNWASSLGSADVLVCNVGPYAHLYHYLRERYDGRFRIVRDVRTSSWSGFLLQEALCGPLTRQDDLVIFPSEFCRRYFINAFPTHLNENNTVVSYPLDISFPQPIAGVRRSGQKSDPIRLGYIGRISADKNVDQVLDLFSNLATSTRTPISLHLAGPFDRTWIHGSLRKIRRRTGSLADRIIYYGDLPYRKIWEYFQQIDVLLFPAMSSVESLGRVLLEAQHSGVPVVAADYAAASEVLPESNLVAPILHTNRDFDLLASFSFGRLDLDDMRTAMLHLGCYETLAPRYHADWYLRAVIDGNREESTLPLSATSRAFIRAIRFIGLPSYSCPEAMAMCERLVQFYRRYNDNRLWPRLTLAVGSIAQKPLTLSRLGLYAHRLTHPHERLTLGHAREHCLAAGFRPRLRLAADTFIARRAVDETPGAATADAIISQHPDGDLHAETI
jgi:glycosyltransferase involved in cell wall biosynthesis